MQYNYHEMLQDAISPKILPPDFGSGASPMSSDKGQEVANRQPRRHAGTGLYVKAPSGMRLRHRKIRRLVEKMRTEMPWIEPSDLPACRAWAELEILGACAFSE